jgi:hypothetical protein
MTDWLKTYDWWLDACRLRVGLIKRPQPQVPHMTPPKYKAELTELDKLAAWIGWVAIGKKPPRPPFIWKKVPQYAWVIWGEYQVAHPKPQPDPKPPPADRPYSRWTLEQIGGFGFRLAWVFRDGARTGGYTPTSLVERVKNAKEPHTGKRIRYLSIEGAPQCNPNPETNEPYFEEFITACHAAGIQARLWERTDDVDWAHVEYMMDTYPGFDVYEADLEDFPVKDPTIPKKFAAKYPGKPRSTLYAGMVDASFYTDWINADFAAGTQSYSHETWPDGHPVPPGIAGAMNQDCWWRGCWLIKGLNGLCSIPMIGVNQEGDGGVERQLPCVKDFDGNWGIEWFESCEDVDLKVFGI